MLVASKHLCLSTNVFVTCVPVLRAWREIFCILFYCSFEVLTIELQIRPKGNFNYIKKLIFVFNPIRIHKYIKRRQVENFIFIILFAWTFIHLFIIWYSDFVAKANNDHKWMKSLVNTVLRKSNESKLLYLKSPVLK